MKELFQFGIHHEPKYPQGDHDIVIPCREDFEALLALSRLKDPSLNPNYGSLVFDVTDPNLAVALEMVESITGLTPLTSKLDRHQRKNWFSCRIERVFDRKDITQAPLLELLAKKEVACQAPAHHPEAYVLRADAKLKNSKWHYGYVDVHVAPLCDDHLRTQLEAEKLRGLRFDAVSYSPPEKAHYRTLWRMSSSIQMPRLRTPLVDCDGKPFVGPLGNQQSGYGCYPDDGIASPAILRFSQEDVAAMGPFDTAVTQERIGSWDATAYRAVIVSQRFRQVFERLKIPGAEFIPVRLDDT
jgi:hypothetical protein